MEAVPGGVLVSGTDESLWRAVLQSRVAETARLRLSEPFHAPDVQSLDARLRDLPWGDCLRHGVGDLGAAAPEMPLITAHSVKSRLYHTRLIEERVAAAIEASRAAFQRSPAAVAAAREAEGTAMHPSSGSVTAPSRSPPPPSVQVHLRHDECQVSIGAAGPLHKRGYRTAVGEAPLRETLAAACVMASPLLHRLTVAAHAGDDLVVWDPFCGSGVLLLEALGIALGQPPGHPKKRYPFASFPCHDEREYADLAGKLEPTPHLSLSRLTLLGTDRCPDQVEGARRNLRRFTRRLWHGADAPGVSCGASGASTGAAGSCEVPAQQCDELGEGSSGLPCAVSFAEGYPAKLVRGLAGKPTMILTNMPYGVLSGARADPRSGHSDAVDAYSQLGRMLRQNRADWCGVFCVVADAEDFREQTGLEWTSELRFMNGGRWADLLQWTGRPARSRVPSAGSHGGGRGRGRPATK